MARSAEDVNRRAAAVSLATNSLLTCLKLVAAILTRSVSMFSEACHSGTDVFAALVAYLSIRAAAVPPDDDHPYGHGKIESMSAFGEGVLLLGVVVLVIYQAVSNLIRGASPQRLDLGLIAMSVSACAALGLGRYLVAVARRSGSEALNANGRHMLLDFWTSLGVMTALAIQRVTGYVHADALVALAIGAWLGFGAWRMASESFQQIIDRRIGDEELATIHRILRETPTLLSYHKLRTRHSGNVHYVDLHAVVPNDWSVVEAHQLADGLEKEIADALAPAQVVVHIDPFDPQKAARNAE